MTVVRRKSRAARGEARPPSVPVISVHDEVAEAEGQLAGDLRRLEYQTSSGVYARRQQEL